jgi:Metal binding domain of Ada
MNFNKFSASNSMILFFCTFVISTTKCALSAENQSIPAATKETQKFNCSQSLNNNQISQSIPYKYVGCSFSKKFHRPSCMFAKAISRNHLVLFHWRKEAIAAQYQPCRYCLPPVWLSTHCTLLPVNSKMPPSKHSQ